MSVWVVIRTKNEEQWLPRCLAGVTKQVCTGAQVVIVDNDSRDATLSIARQYGCRIVSISDRDFTYGRSLNIGIEATDGNYAALLSGHCIPVHERWLATLRATCGQPEIGGVYGRQEPLPDTAAVDKRDLWTSFGVERRVQRRDPFFHNANSMIRRATWVETPFDEHLNGVEDRDWAKRVFARGYAVVYEPQASVYHYHGIHHGRDEHRAERVARVLEILNHRSAR